MNGANIFKDWENAFTGEKLENGKRIPFLTDENRVEADIEYIRRKRQRIAAALEEVRNSLSELLKKAPTLELLQEIILEPDARKRRVHITRLWLELQTLPIELVSIEAAVDAVKMPGEAVAAIVAADSLLPEDRTPETIEIYWQKTAKKFGAPGITEAEKLRIRERHTWYTDSVETQMFVFWLQNLASFLNFRAKKVPGANVSAAYIKEHLPWMIDFVVYTPAGLEIDLNRILHRGRSFLVAGEVPEIELSPMQAANLLNRLKSEPAPTATEVLSYEEAFSEKS